MGDLDVLTKMPKTNYTENTPNIDFFEFEKVVQSRRSVRVYNEEKIPEEIVNKCLDNALLAPNSSNLQPWQFYWVRNEEKKKVLKKYCLDQLAATTAQELIVCVARTDKWKHTQELMIKELYKENENPPKGAVTYYKKIVPMAYNQGPLNILGFIKKCLFFFRGLKMATPREPTSYADMRVWAHKSTALACENLMLSFRAYGYDSCPMEGMDSKKIKDLLSLPKGAEICMVVSAGKRADNGVFGKRIRMPRDQFVFEI